MIGYDGIYKIGDLGLMAQKGRLGPGSNNIVEGDNRYMAPETLQGIFTSRADVFSLGITLLSVVCDIELPKNGDMWHKVRFFQHFEIWRLLIWTWKSYKFKF